MQAEEMTKLSPILGLICTCNIVHIIKIRSLIKLLISNLEYKFLKLRTRCTNSVTRPTVSQKI